MSKNSNCGYCGVPLSELDPPGVCVSCARHPLCSECGEMGANVRLGRNLVCIDCVPDHILHPEMSE